MTSFPKRHLRDRIGAAVCLPAALLSVLLSVAPAPAHAAPNPGHVPNAPTRERLISIAARGGPMTLVMYEGPTLSGRLAGFFGDWQDTVQSDVRYEAWRAAQTARAPRLDEALVIVPVAGDTLRGTFEGVTGDMIALRTTATFIATPVRMDEIRHVRTVEGDVFGPWPELRERLAGAPKLVAVGLLRGVSGSVLVSRSRILEVAAVPGTSSGLDDGGFGILLGLGLGVLICMLAVNQASSDLNDAFSSCGLGEGPSTSSDRRFGTATLQSGPAAWPRGETRRP